MGILVRSRWAGWAASCVAHGKEKNRVDWAGFGEKRQNGPAPVLLMENLSSFSNLFQIENYFEFKSNLNSERFLLTKLNQIAHITSKEFM
jgi:hypothetical protein